MVLASALRTDRRHFRSLEPQRDDIRTLRAFSRRREELVTERTRHINRLVEQLWVYYPQFKEIVGDDTIRPWIIELWQLAQTPDAARRIRVSSVRKVLKRHRIRRISAEEVLGVLRSKKINISPSAVSDCVWRIQSIIEHFNLVSRQIKEIETRIGEMLDAIISRERTENAGTARPGDVEILLSMPGVGFVTAATMVAECYDLIRRRDHRALRCVTGTAPVTKQSGKSKYVMRRRASSRRLTEALYHWAGAAVLCDPASKARYRCSLRARGLRHSRSLRSVGDRLLRVACTLLERGELFDKKFKTPPQPAAA
jgi:transposase